MNVYLNSTLINPGVSINTINNGNLCVYLGVNITGHIKNMGNIKIHTNPSYLSVLNCTGENVLPFKHYKLQYYYSVTLYGFDNFVKHNGYNNITVEVSIGKYIYDKFNINSIKETAIYGFVYRTGATGPDSSINNTVYAYDLNNSETYNVNITNGCYYFFTIPGNYYKFYYYNSTTTHPIKVADMYILKATNKSFQINIPLSELS